MRARIATGTLLLLFLVAARADAKTYSADRFDASIRLLPGGSMEVTETVAFRFESGTFQTVFREIPRRRTDDIQILRATIDGRELPFGTDRGEVEVSGRSRVHVRWRFEPVSESTHLFTLTYLVRGVVHRTDGADVISWRALPGQHDYRIERSTIDIEYPAALLREPSLETRRVEAAGVEHSSQRVRIVASGIRRNGWVQPSLHFPPGTLTAAAPAWQQAQERADALAPRWIAAAAVAGLLGLLGIWMLRQRYDAPAVDFHAASGVIEPPDTLPPAIGGALASNGRISLEHTMAALFSLAASGEIAIREDPRGFLRQRSFTLERRRTSRPLIPHEQTALDTVFQDGTSTEPSVTLSKARSRLTRRMKHFRNTLREEMTVAGLFDRERQRLHHRYGVLAVTLVLVAIAGFFVAGFLAREYRGWPLLVPSAIILVAIVAIIVQGATTPLSNEGVRRRERWRAYRTHLKQVAGREVHLTVDSPAHVLPLAVALGLASAWSKLVERHPLAVPTWFHALAEAGDDGGFPAFIAAGGASGSGGGGAGAGAAGGGASGAG